MLPFHSPWAVIWARRWRRLVAVVAIVVLAATAIVIAAAEAQRLARSLHHDCLTKTKKMLANHTPRGCTPGRDLAFVCEWLFD